MSNTPNADNGTILKIILDVQKTVNESSGDIKVMKEKTESIDEKVITHGDILFGDPKRMGEGGLVYTTQLQEGKIVANKKAIKSVKTTFVMIWSGITILTHIIAAYVRSMFTGS